MKHIGLLLALACIQNAHAQDYCKRIKKEVSDDKTTYEYNSPYNQSERPPLTLRRMYNISEDDGFDNFILQFRISSLLDDIYTKTADGGQVEKNEKELVVEFEDHTKFTDATIEIDHDISDDRIFAIRYVNFQFTPDNIKDFATKKIMKFSLAGVSQAVAPDSAAAMIHYIDCMKKVRQ